MKRLLFLSMVLTVVLVVLFLSSVSAQEEERSPQCDPAQVSERITTAIADLEAAQDLEELIVQLEALVAVRTSLANLDSQCHGLDFEGSAQTVSDPVVIPAGIYRVTATTEGYLIVAATVLEGNCDQNAILILSAGQANQGAQTLFESEGCTLLWEISNVTAPYNVTFEKMK